MADGENGAWDPPTESEVSQITNDDMLCQDKEEATERVAYLEKKVSQQEDEIVCLKAALADVIRRLGLLESASQSMAKFQNSSKPSSARPRSVAGPSDDAARIRHVPPFNNRSRTSMGGGPTNRSNTSLNKSSSLSTSIDMGKARLTTHHSSKSSSSKISNGDSRQFLGNNKPRSSREPYWNQEDGCLKMYLRGRGLNLYAPTDVVEFNPDKAGQAPDQKLQLEWVYGYRGRDCRSNLYYLPTGEVVYFVAGVVVLHNPEENTQRHYLGHTDDIKCLAIHPSKMKIATGQVAGHDTKEGKPHVRVWDAANLTTLHVIGLGFFSRAVCCVAFSKVDDCEQLLAVDEANEHILSVWDLSKDKPHKIADTKSSTEAVLAAEFHPTEKNSFVTCGKSMITFWNLEGGSLAKKNGIFDKHEKPKYVLTLAFADDGDVLSGDSNGNIYVWGKGTNRITAAIVGAHDGGVFSLFAAKDGTYMSGGGKDRKIIQWDSNYKKTGKETELSEAYGPVRTLSQGKGGLILVGTTRNCVLSGSLDLEFSVIVQGHTDELWGLASHPTQHQFMTCGTDRQLYVWDSQSRTVVWNKEMNDEIHCCCIHPNGAIAAIGTCVARWMVLDLSTREVVSVHTDGNEQIECIQYSPDGNMLAVGSRDNFVYVYQVSEDGRKYAKIGRCGGHSSFITHVDWSKDSQYIASNSGDYELLYWTASTCKQQTNAEIIREMDFATQTCVLGFNTAGIWPEGADGTDVNGCGKSNNNQLLATCDDFGKVNLFAYPCPQPKTASHPYKGHSSHVTSVNFLFDDSRLISTGGKDCAIMQWQVV